MRSPTRHRLGQVLILVAVVGVVGSLTVSAATAPSVKASPANNTTSGRTLVGMQAAGGVSMLNSSGDPIWQIGSKNTDYFDVTMLKNGTVLAGFIAQGYHSCGRYRPPCARTGFRIIDPDPKPHIVTERSFPVRTKLNSEVHDVNPLPNGNFLLTDMEHERILIVAPNGTVTWQWDANRFYDSPPDPTQKDWLHINDVDRIGPGRYMVSVRNANQLLIIKRGQGVVDVINKDKPGSSDANCKQSGQLADYHNDSNGDVRCGDPALLNHQHNPEYLGPDAILVADSDNNRVVELHNHSGNWSVAWEVNSANGLRFNWPRDADRLPNGNTLITDSRNNRVVEVAPNGTTVWSVHTGIWPYDADRLPPGSRHNADRLPRYGERLNSDRLPRMNNSTLTGAHAGRSTLPLLGPAYNGLSYEFQLPVWFQPWHIGVIAAGIVLAIIGRVVMRSGRRNQ